MEHSNLCETYSNQNSRLWVLYKTPSIYDNTKNNSLKKRKNFTGNWSNTSCSLGGSSTAHENLNKDTSRQWTSVGGREWWLWDDTDPAKDWMGQGARVTVYYRHFASAK